MSKPWPRVKLGEVLSLDLDKVAIDPSQRYPMVGVLSFGRGLFDREPIDNGNTSYKYFLRLKINHFVMSQLFGWEGALAVSSEQFSGKFVSPQFPTFVCDEKKLELGFLGWCAKRKVFWDELGTRTNGMGDRRRTLNPAALFESGISLPPIDEQRRIVARIDAVQQQLQQADTLRSSIDHDIASLLAVRFQETLKQAEWLPMRVVAPIVRRDVVVDHQSNYAELGIRCFGKGTFHKPTLSGIELGSKRVYRIEPGDLMFSNVFAWEGAIAVAKPEDTGRVGSHRFISCAPNDGLVTAEYLRYYFLTDEGMSKIRDASPGGAGRNRTLGLSKLMELEVPMPNPISRASFVDLYQRLLVLRLIRNDEKTEVEAVVPALVQRLMTRLVLISS